MKICFQGHYCVRGWFFSYMSLLRNMRSWNRSAILSKCWYNLFYRIHNQLFQYMLICDYYRCRSFIISSRILSVKFYWAYRITISLYLVTKYSISQEFLGNEDCKSQSKIAWMTWKLLLLKAFLFHWVCLKSLVKKYYDVTFFARTSFTFLHIMSFSHTIYAN